MDSGGARIEKKKTVKRQIRDTTRLLSREDLPETVRQTKERMLKSLQQELTDKATEKRSKKVAKKYRMVKFFERRKISRKLKSKLKEYSATTDERERSTLLEELQCIRKELNYVIHFPEEEKYIALYPSSETTSAKATARKEKLLAGILARVEEGELPDAAEKEAQWSSVITTAMPSAKSQVNEFSKCAVSADKMLTSGSKTTRTDASEETKRTVDKTVAGIARQIRPQRKRQLAPVDEEPSPESKALLQIRRQLKEDDFFLMSNTI